MTNSLHNELKQGDFVEIIVDEEMKDCYFPSFLHRQIGFIWMIDEDHIWIKTIRYNEGKNPYISSPDRYCWHDITVENVNHKAF